MATSNIATLRPFSLAEQCHTQNFYTLYETLNDTLYDTVAMLYCRGGHWVWRGQHMLQHKSQTNKETPSWAVPHSEFLFCQYTWVHTTSYMGSMFISFQQQFRPQNITSGTCIITSRDLHYCFQGPVLLHPDLHFHFQDLHYHFQDLHDCFQTYTILP